jgi:hypothetical protein
VSKSNNKVAKNMIELVKERYVKGSIGYLNEKAKENGFVNWTEYYRYQLKKQEEKLYKKLYEREKKKQEKIMLKKEKMEKKQMLYQSKIKYNSRLRLMDLINLDSTMQVDSKL